MPLKTFSALSSMTPFFLLFGILNSLPILSKLGGQPKFPSRFKPTQGFQFVQTSNNSLLLSNDDVSIVIHRGFLLRVNDGCGIQLLDDCRAADFVTRFERRSAIDLGL
jgi:hypothetical protein